MWGNFILPRPTMVSMGLALGGLVWGAITLDAMIPALMAASGVAIAVVHLYRAPRDALIRADVTAALDQIKHLEGLLDEEQKGREQDRERLTRWIEEETRTCAVLREKYAICQAAMAEAARRIQELENHGAANPRPPVLHDHDPDRMA